MESETCLEYYYDTMLARLQRDLDEVRSFLCAAAETCSKKRLGVVVKDNPGEVSRTQLSETRASKRGHEKDEMTHFAL